MELVHYPHPALSAPTRELREGEIPDLEDRVRAMFAIMYDSQGIGLAAPQVAWSVRLCTINHTQDESQGLVLINPRIRHPEGHMDGEEGCLSLPGIYTKVRRYAKVTVDYQDLDFASHTMECTDLLARVVQHEVDHLDSLLLIHRMSKTEKFKNRKKIKDLKERFESAGASKD